MIIFSNDELKYIKQEFKNAIKKVNDIHGAELFEYVRSVGAESIDSAIAVVELDDINDVNKDEELNKICADALYWILGYYVWVDSYMETADKVSFYVGNNCYCSIYEKIINDPEDED